MSVLEHKTLDLGASSEDPPTPPAPPPRQVVRSPRYPDKSPSRNSKTQARGSSSASSPRSRGIGKPDVQQELLRLATRMMRSIVESAS